MGNVLRYLVVRLLVPADDIAGDLCIDQAGIHSVHANTVLGIFQSGRPTQADDTVLGGDVGANAGVAGQRADRRVIDDRYCSGAPSAPARISCSSIRREG